MTLNDRITGDMARLVFSKLTELHTVVHDIANVTDEELPNDVDALLEVEDPLILQGMLVAAIGLVSRGELLAMRELVENAVASGAYDEVMDEITNHDNDEKKG